ncbi:MAG: prephenate dehydrogenase [Mariprofundaceae bacterium]
MKAGIKHLVIIGTGLIGGSLALALRKAGAVRRVTGVGRSADNLRTALQLGIVDDWSQDIGAAVSDADVVVLTVPMGAYADVLEAMADSLPADAVLTDAGSTKCSAVAAVKASRVNASQFVPAHPIAGTEASGAAAAFAELFQDRLCILTPDETTDNEAAARVESMWRQAGARLMRMTAGEHDEVLAAVSHLPHLAAFALVNTVRRSGESGRHDPFSFAAGGFRDFTRIASSSPEMWRDIALNNRRALLEQMKSFQQELSRLEAAISAGDGEALLAEFRAAKVARDAWLAEHGGMA